MKTMKMKFKSIMLALAISAVSVSSCSLEENPSSFVSPKNFYKTKEQCIASLNSCYIPLKSIFQFTYMLAMEGCTDLMWVASGTMDSQLAISPANPLFGQSMWTNGYKGVMYSNAVIAGITNSKTIKDSEKRPLIAEGMVMRAYYYYFLTSTFGDVPFYTEDVSDEVVLERVAKMGRMSAKATRAYLIDELLKNIQYLPQKRTVDLPEQRSGAAVGWMLVAKMALWNGEWAIARDACLELEKMYGDLEQYPLNDIMFRNKNTPESIFEIQYTYSSTGLKVTSNFASVCTPTRSSANNGYTYDGVVIEELGNQATTWTALRPNQYYYSSLQTKDGVDLRKNLNMAWDYNGVAFSNVATRPWLGPKFWCPGMVNSADSNNPKVFRYADAVLMLSEAYLRLGERELSKAKLNIVRKRAGTAPYDVDTNDQALLEEIQKERGRELFGEFSRKYDLVRWGIWYQQTYDYTDYASLKQQILPCHEYYPIPDKEVVYSGYALDNNAYAKFGL